MPKTEELDEELAAGLKQAKAKRMYFAIVLKGAADGALIVSKQKVPPKAIAEAKKKSGGSAVIRGACFGEDGKHIFEVAKEPPATLANALKLIARRDSGQSIHAECRVGASPDLLDDEQLEQEGAEGGVPTAKDATAPKPGATAKPTATPQAPTKGPLPTAEKYAAALKTWEQASAAALSAIEKLVSALEATGDELALAIASVVEELQASFPDTLDDVLTNLAQAAKTGNPNDTETYRVRSEIAIKAALAYLNNNAQTIDGCEHNPFGVGVAFRAPLTEALKQVLIAVK